MPYYRSKRRYSRKSSRRSHGKMKKRSFKSWMKSKKAKGTAHVYKLRKNFDITTADLTTGLYGSLTNPEAILGGTGGYQTDWASIKSLYDSFRLCALKLEWLPVANTNYASGGQTAGPSPLYYPSIYRVFDVDNPGVTGVTIPSVDEMEEYEKCKMKNPYRPFKWYFKCPKYSVNPGVGGTLSLPVLAKGYYYPTNGDPLTTWPAHGVWYLRSPSTPYDDIFYAGRLRITQYIACKNRK